MSKWSIYDLDISEMLSQGRVDHTQMAREILTKTFSTPDSDDVDVLRTYIRRVSRRRQHGDFVDITDVLSTANDDVYNKEESDNAVKVISSWNPITGKNMPLEEYCKHYNLPFEDVKSYKLVSHTGTPYYNILFRERSLIEDVDYRKVIEDVIKNVGVDKAEYTAKPASMPDSLFTRVVYTDTHIGMDPDPEGISMYAEPWNELKIRESIIDIVDGISQHHHGDTLIIDDLGDFLDGYDGYTTRGGHKLPQNMSNLDAFRYGLEMKLMMLDMVYDNFKVVIINNICNDNHSGDFGAMLNIAFKQIAEERYSNVKINNIFSFIGHYIIGRHAFVLSHGKDKKNLKFGFKPMLDTKQIEHIDNYLKANDIYQKASFIEFSKGDSHQFLLDYSTSQDFNYMNYPALSPSSEWVQTNFKKGRRGFVIQHGNMFKKDLTIIPITL